MKTIKAKDAKIGEWYRDHKYGNVKCVSESDETKLAGFVTRSGTFRFFGDPREIEHLPECDSFDWQPAAEGSNGVRWYKDEDDDVRCYPSRTLFVISSEGIFSATEEATCIEGGDKEITTSEALALINANNWPEGVAKAKELAGIVDEVETEPSPVGVMDSMLNAMGYKRCDAEPAPKEANTVLTDLVSGKWKESEEVRWYLDEGLELIQGFCERGEINIEMDTLQVRQSHNTSEQTCIDDSDTKLSTPEVLYRLARAGHVAAWNEARKLAGMSEQEAYLAGQSVCGIEVGDTVRVTRKAEDKEMGWFVGCFNVDAVDSLWIVYAVDDGSYELSDNCWHPFFVLEKIETSADEATPVTAETPAEVVPEIDPGEGWRLIDKSVDEPMEGDERWGWLSQKWAPRTHPTNPFDSSVTYRRRIQPASIDYTQWQEPIGVGNDYPLPVGTVIEYGETDLLATIADKPSGYRISNATFPAGGFVIGSATYKWRVKSYPQPAADHVNKWAGGYWSLGKWVSGRPCGVEVVQ